MGRKRARGIGVDRLKAALLLALLAWPAHSGGARELAVAAVQLRVDRATLSAPGEYERALRRAVRDAAAQARLDLVVFPEYAGAFLAVADWGRELAEAPDSAALLARAAAADPSLATARGFFEAQASRSERRVQEVFGSLARQYDTWVLAGTYFASGPNGALRNRAVLFSPAGRIAYVQDKVFLTEIEERWLGIEPGRLEDARLLELAGATVRLTICRDTFEAAWEPASRSADLWIDIKANGTAFTPAEEESFARALPARLAATGVPYGLTVCLTGRLLEFLWEGRTALYRSDATGVHLVQRAETADGAEVFTARLALPP